jgi:hypothetical protein
MFRTVLRCIQYGITQALFFLLLSCVLRHLMKYVVGKNRPYSMDSKRTLHKHSFRFEQLHLSFAFFIFHSLETCHNAIMLRDLSCLTFNADGGFPQAIFDSIF